MYNLCNMVGVVAAWLKRIEMASGADAVLK
jgi:hypothetical protein